MTTQQTIQLGTLISSQEGRCAGPNFGEAYTAPAGEHGYVSGRRNTANRGLGLMDREWHATKKAAMDRAVSLSDYS